jgi:hypothetical protein
MTIDIKTDKKGYFFRWYEIMNPFFNLAPSERKTLALIVNEYYKNLSKVKDKEIAWKLAMDYDAKTRAREDLGDISFNSHANILTSLRKRGILVNNRVVSPYLANLDKEICFKFSIYEDRSDNKEHSK